MIYVVLIVLWLLAGLITNMICNIKERDKRYDFTLYSLFEDCLLPSMLGFISPLLVLIFAIEDKSHNIVLKKGKKDE